MATKNYVIINDSNEIIVNNAYGELKQLYKQNYRTNDLLALKALVKSIENGILDEIDLQPENHQALIDIINGQTYSEDTLRSFDIYPEDMMLDTNYTVNFDGLHNLLTSILGETNNTFTSKHANDCVKVSAYIDNIITDMFKKNAKNLSREEELKVTIANILSKEQKFDTSKYDVNALTKTFTTDQSSVNKVKSKIVGVFKKIDNGSTSGDTYIINVGGYNADQRTINTLAKDLNDLYRDLYKESDFQVAAAYASIMTDLVNNYFEGDKFEYLQNLVNNVDESIRDRVADKVNTLADSLDNEYVYTEEDKNGVNAINEAAQAKLAEVQQHNAELNEEISAKQAEYDAAVAAYPTNHNGDEYSGTIITNPGKTIRPSEDKTNELNNIATQHVIKFEVTWVKDNGGLDEVYYVIKDSVLQFIDNPVKEGYTFEGWFINDEKVEGEVIVTSNITLTAHWTQIIPEPTSVTITWVPGHNLENTIQTVDKDSNISLPADPVFDGYTFNGWFTEEQGGEQVTADMIADTDKTFYAQWTEVVEPERYYFGAFSESIIENGAFNFNGLELTTESEFFNESTDDYNFRTITSTYPNFIKYVLVPNEYLNNVTVQDATFHSPFVTNHAFTDGAYTLLDYTGWNEGNGIGAKFEMKLGGSSVNENTVIETLEPEPQPQDGVYFSIGITPIDETNYTTANNATTEIPESIIFESSVRNYHYILIPADKHITIVDTDDNAPINFTEQTDIVIPNHKVYKTNGPLNVGGRVTITLS